MGYFIGQHHKQEISDYVKRDNSPIGVMVDGATDNSQNHYICLYIVTLEEDRPKVFFYGVPTVGSQENADGLLDVMEKEFSKNGIWEQVKERLISFVAELHVCQ